jgi:hypothetical protein
MPVGWNVYWYDSDGFFLFMVHLSNDAVPIPPDRAGVLPSLDIISAGPEGRKLFVKIDYYRNIDDDASGTGSVRSGIEPDSSCLWVMNAESGLWEWYLELPFFEYSTLEQNRYVISRMPYSLLGITKNKWGVFTFPVDEGYSIITLPLEPGAAFRQRRAFVDVDLREIQFNVFYLSADGILSGLLVNDWQVELVWWRTDRFLDGS